MESKTFNTTLILDWKSGKFRAVKKISKLKATDIPIKFNLKVNIPQMPELTATGEITLDDTKVSEIVVEEL